jgi:hypothetical protein
MHRLLLLVVVMAIVLGGLAGCSRDTVAVEKSGKDPFKRGDGPGVPMADTGKKK